jgi:protein-disulfide isomerase
MLPHEAALAAGSQGKFWEMHDLLFENQSKLARSDLIEYAKELDLDMAAFFKALDNHTYRNGARKHGAVSELPNAV